MASPKTKAMFLVKHRKNGNRVKVARLLMWDDGLLPSSSSSDAVNGSATTAAAAAAGNYSSSLFPEPKIHIVQLDNSTSSTLTELESNNNHHPFSSTTSSSSLRLLSFYDAQCDLEECCTTLLQQYSTSSKATAVAIATKKNGGGDDKDDEEEEERKVYKYAVQFQKAVDMALNCLALDVGADIIVPGRGKEEGVLLLETPMGGDDDGGGGVAVASNVTTVATASASVKNKEENEEEKVEVKKTKKQVGGGETRVQNLEVAVPPPPTTTNATTTTDDVTTKPKAAPKEMKQEQVVIPKKEGTTRAESKRGGGGGTKSRPEASQTIPKKFQSASKPTAAATAAAVTKQAPTTTTTDGGGGVAVASNVTTVATASASVKNKEENEEEKVEVKKTKKQVGGGETRVQNLEVAVPPPPTTTNATTTTDDVTTKPKAAPKEMKQEQVVIPKKEGTTRAESKRGGGGGTKSRPEASQTIPKKFQSAFKPTAAATAAAATKQAPTTTTTIMNQKSPLPWKEVWKIMRSKGWTWKCSTGLMTGYRYIKPGCKIKNGQENIDYFNSESAVQIFARNVYGWGGLRNTTTTTVEALEQVIEDHAKYAGEVVPPLHPSTSIIGPNDPWRDVWDKMRLSGGWTWKTGSGLMMDYYYIKPNCTIKGGVKGQDYFEEVEEVQKFAKRNYGWVGEVMEGEEDGGSERPALIDLNENKLPEKRRRTEKVAVDKPVAKKVETLKSKTDKVKPIKEEEVMEEEEEEDEEEFEEEVASNENDVNDDDNMSRFSEARSTYSQSGFQSKKLFINECADENVPSLEGEQIYPDDPWTAVWKTMRKAGWTWKGGSGLMMGYYYIKPGCNVKDGVEGEDYFVSEEDVQRFAERNYGWNCGVTSDDCNSRGRGRKRSLSTSSDKSHFSEANDDCASAEIKTKKTAKKIQQSPNKEQNEHTSLRPDPYTWKTLWPALQNDGWRVVKAGKYNQLHDWYYVRPDCDPGDGSSELNIDYFLSEEDVSGFARQTNYFDGYEESEPAFEECAEPAQSKQTNQAPKRVKSSSKHPSTPEGCKTVPQDPAKPLLSSAESCSSQSSSSSNDYYDWKNFWPVLQAAGWRVIKAFNPLHDWYYVRPNRDPKDSRTKLGRHYFACPDDVIDFVKRAP